MTVPSATSSRKAPEFSLPDESGNACSLKTLLQKGPLMIVFYPGDFTPVCTKQLCQYRDYASEFAKYGVQVVGISKNSAESHTKFKTHYQFPFALLTDNDNRVARAFGCTSKLLFGGVSRGIYVVNRNGEIVYEFVETTPLTRRKSEELVTVLKELKNSELV